MKNILIALIAFSILFFWVVTVEPRRSAKGPGQKRGDAVLEIVDQFTPPGIVRITGILQHLSHPGVAESTQLNVQGARGVKLSFHEVPIGLWTLVVRAKDNSGVTQYGGITQVQIVQDETTKVSLRMVSINPAHNKGVRQFVWGRRNTKWQMLEDNPVIRSIPGTWDERHFYIIAPTVLRVGDELKMWYTSGYAVDQHGIDSTWTALATSRDGILWEKRGPVLSSGEKKTWCEKGRVGRSVLLVRGIYHMWFEGKSQRILHNGIGHATSADGKYWTVDPEPVVRTSVGRPSVFGPCVLLHQSKYFLYYTVEYNYASYFHWKIFLAESPDAQNWQDQGIVLEARQGVAWEENGPFVPCVLFDEGKFKMYYGTITKTGFCIGYAESNDGRSWRRISDLPELIADDTQPWKTIGVAYPWIMRDGKLLRMWFCGLTAHPNLWHIGYAER